MHILNLHCSCRIVVLVCIAYCTVGTTVVDGRAFQSLFTPQRDKSFSLVFIESHLSIPSRENGKCISILHVMKQILVSLTCYDYTQYICIRKFRVIGYTAFGGNPRVFESQACKHFQFVLARLENERQRSKTAPPATTKRALTTWNTVCN